MPALSTSHSFLAIDLPGHGYSSQLPKGMFYNFLNGPLLVQYICEYYKWPKISLMGHSKGSVTSFTYTTYLPDNVDLLICLDGLYPLVFPNDTENNGKLIQNFFKYAGIDSKFNKPPCYTLEVMEKKLYEGSGKSILLENAKYVLNRNITPSKENPGLYYFTIDPRLKAGSHFSGVPSCYKRAGKRIKCPVFISLSEGCLSSFNKELYEEYVNDLKAQKNVELYFVPGTHHVHLNEPEHLQQLISKFLKKYNADDCLNDKIDVN